jgi:hypothetical protein
MRKSWRLITKKRRIKCKEEVEDRVKAAEEAGWEAEAWGRADTASALPVVPGFRTSREDPAIRYPVPSAEQK